MGREKIVSISRIIDAEKNRELAHKFSLAQWVMLSCREMVDQQVPVFTEDQMRRISLGVAV